MKKQFRVLLITGSRQVGKSTLLKEKLLPDYGYVTLDDFTELGLAQKDPALFFKIIRFLLLLTKYSEPQTCFCK